MNVRDMTHWKKSHIKNQKSQFKKKKNETTTNQQKFEKKSQQHWNTGSRVNFFKRFLFLESAFSTRSPQRYPLKGAVDVHGQDAAAPLKLCCSEIQLLESVDGVIGVMMLMWFSLKQKSRMSHELSKNKKNLWKIL